MIVSLSGLTPIVTFDHEYDAGRLAETAVRIGTDSAGQGGTADYVNRYTYDALHRLKRITQGDSGSGNAVAEKRVEFTYFRDSQFASIRRYSDLDATELVASSNYSYDGRGRLESLVHANGSTTFADYGFTYDAADRLTGFSNSVYTGESATYTYDPRGQLTGADRTGTAYYEAYDYDDNGNRDSAGFTPGTNNQIATDGTHNYSYDHEGNITRKIEIDSGYYTQYTWDPRNRLVTVTEYSDTDTELQRIEYRYDAFNQLVGRKLFSAGNSTPFDSQVLVYDNGQVVLEFESQESGADLTIGALAHRTLWGPAVDQLLADEQVDWSDSDADGEVFLALTDHLGTVRDMVDNNGVERRHAVFDSFGDVESISYFDVDGELIIGTQPWSHADAAQSPFLYTGRYFDAETGLQNNLHRWYDASTGRWISEDPIGFAAGDANLTRYVGNEPTRYVDPSGLIRPGSARKDLLDEALTGRIGPDPVGGNPPLRAGDFPLHSPRSPNGVSQYSAYDAWPVANAIVNLGAVVVGAAEMVICPAGGSAAIPFRGASPIRGAARAASGIAGGTATRAPRPGLISGNPANQLLETGTPLRSGEGWVRRWYRISPDHAQAYRNACAERLDQLYLETRGMPDVLRRPYHFQEMSRFRDQWLKDFLERRNY